MKLIIIQENAFQIPFKMAGIQYYENSWKVHRLISLSHKKKIPIDLIKMRIEEQLLQQNIFQIFSNHLVRNAKHFPIEIDICQQMQKLEV